MKTALRILLLSALGLLAGCSTTTFLYNRADFILPWMMRDYVSLEREQRELLDELLAPLLRWHRSEELPRYVELIQHIESALDEPVTPAVLQDLTLEFERAWARLEARSVTLLLELGESVNQRQVDQFLERLADKQSELEEKYLERDSREYADDNFDNMKEGLQDYLGRLDASQKQRLRDAAQQLLRADQPWLQERARWLALLGDILQRQPGWQQALWQALEDRPNAVSDEYQQVYAHNSQVLQQALSDVLNSRSAAQDERLRRKLRNFREDFQSLVDQGLERAAAEAAAR